jgi:Methyltransferase domain
VAARLSAGSSAHLYRPAHPALADVGVGGMAGSLPVLVSARGGRRVGGYRLIVDVPESSKPLKVVLEFTDGPFLASSSPYQLLRRNGPEVVRANYKGVWNEVATDVSTAEVGVAGTTDEGEFERTAHEGVSLLRATVGVYPDDVILGIGAGVGQVGTELTPLCKRWIGADVSENMLSHLRDRLREYPNVETVPLNGWDLSPIESESVDIVYATIVFPPRRVGPIQLRPRRVSGLEAPAVECTSTT